MNNLDVMIQNLTPTVMVPRYELLLPLSDNGHRFLMAADGLWMEAKAPWGHAVMPISLINNVSFPYGPLKGEMEFDTVNKKVPTDMIRLFWDQAKKTPDIERAAWVIYDSRFKTLRLQMLESNHATGSDIEYICPDLKDHESVLMDIHSHAMHSAFFSPEDDGDDKGAFRIAVVLGNLDKAEVTVVARLCMYGMFYDLPKPSVFNYAKGVAA